MIQSARLFLAVPLIALFLTACGFVNPVGQPAFPTELLLTVRDLPFGFVRREYLAIDDVPNAKAFAIGFVVPDGSQFPPIRVSHRLALYADERSAQAAYPAWEKELFPVDEWKAPDGFHFKPAVSGDLYRFGCLPGSFDGKDFVLCRYIQQHSNKISRILANLDGKILKLEDVEKILANLDARLSQAK